MTIYEITWSYLSIEIQNVCMLHTHKLYNSLFSTNLNPHSFKICKRSSFECNMREIQHSSNEFHLINWTYAVFYYISRKMNIICIFWHDEDAHIAWYITVIHCSSNYIRSAIRTDTDIRLILKTTAQSVRTLAGLLVLVVIEIGLLTDWISTYIVVMISLCVIYRPNQHGVDLLSPLSSILNDCTTDHDEVPSAMSLEGLFYLCQAEVRKTPLFQGMDSDVFSRG